MNYTTWDDMPGFVSKAAHYVGYRYRRYVETADVSQELYAWLYADGNRSRVLKWLSAEPQQTTRVYRTLLAEALSYAEQEKASSAGYKPDDVWWYTPHGVEGLLPLALDRDFVQANGHVGDQLAMVIDVRAALDATGLFDFFAKHDESHPDWRVNLQAVVDRLGGERPGVGRRRAIRNATAQAITAGAYE